MQFYLSALLFVLAAHVTLGQQVQWKSIRVTEENEFFNVTSRGIDRYYTQGLRVELFYQADKRKWIEKILIPASPASVNDYSISLSQKIYTPNRKYSYIFLGDMPYSATLFLSQALRSRDSARQLTLTSRLDAGIIGPAALGRNTQSFFHKLIHNGPGWGWPTQMRNDIYLNYALKFEKAITKKNSLLKLEGKGEVNMGTVLVSVVPGLNIESKRWLSRSKNFSAHIFFRPELRVVLYNALLQGGILNQAYAEEFYSQYFIKKIKPLVYSHTTGFEIRFNRMELLYRQTNLTREFTGQKPHWYGTVMLTFPLH